MIIFSPTKTMSNNKKTEKKVTYPFIDKTDYLINKLKSLSIEEIKKQMRVNENISKEVFNYYNQYPVYKSEAINIYNGISYKQIIDDDEKYIDNNVFILSALYGMINGNDIIAPYRLDFLIKKDFQINLYQYWKPTINEVISSMAPKYILNLASKEFSKLINLEDLNIIIYELSFNTDKKISSVTMKKIRGQILNLSIKYKICEIEDYINLETDLFIITKIKGNEVVLNLKNM